ncbi:hypothetical protein T02_2926, partial [Trichinella nativa]
MIIIVLQQVDDNICHKPKAVKNMCRPVSTTFKISSYALSKISSSQFNSTLHSHHHLTTQHGLIEIDWKKISTAVIYFSASRMLPIFFFLSFSFSPSLSFSLFFLNAKKYLYSFWLMIPKNPDNNLNVEKYNCGFVVYGHPFYSETLLLFFLNTYMPSLLLLLLLLSLLIIFKLPFHHHSFILFVCFYFFQIAKLCDERMNESAMDVHIFKHSVFHLEKIVCFTKDFWHFQRMFKFHSNHWRVFISAIYQQYAKHPYSYRHTY